MTYTEKYFSHIHSLLDTLFETQKDNIRALAEKCFETSQNGGKLFFFGCSHAGILAQEAFYRTGGLVTANPILPKGLTLETVPVTDTTVLERKEEYAHEILDNTDIKAGDLLVVHSVSGRNGVPVEMAIEAKKRGIFVACITNITTSSASSSRHSSGKRLYEVSDIVLDNCGCIGDSSLKLEGLAEKTAPTSTIAGAAICNSIVARSIELMIEAGIEPPVFLSANVEGGDEHNARMLEKYKDNVFYM